MSHYKDSLYDRSELNTKRFVLSSGSFEDVRFREPYAGHRRRDLRYAGRSLDRSRDDERRTQPAPRYLADHRSSGRYPVRQPSLDSRQQVSRNASLPLDGRIRKQFQERDVLPGTRRVVPSNQGYSFHGRYSGQNRAGERNPRVFEVGRGRFSPQQQTQFHPRPHLNEPGVDQHQARQAAFGKQHVFVTRSSDASRLALNNSWHAQHSVNNVNGNLAPATHQNIGTSPAPYEDTFNSDGAVVPHSTQFIGEENLRPGPRENLNNVRFDFNPNLPPPLHESPLDQGYNHSGNIDPGTPMIIHAHDNTRNGYNLHSTPGLQADESANAVSSWPQNSTENPTMHSDYALVSQELFFGGNHAMEQANAAPNAEVAMVGPDGTDYGHLASNDQTQGATPLVDRNMEELISQLPSRNNRIISVEGIKHHQDQQRRKVSRPSGPPIDAFDDASQGRTLPPVEEAEIGAAEAQEELQTLRGEALPLAERRDRRRHLQQIIQKEALSHTQEFVASISSVAHTSEGVISSVFDKIDVVNLVKKKMEAEAGASVAAVFDLCSDLLRLNLFLAVILLSTVIIPSWLWTVDDGVSFGHQSVSNRILIDCANFSNDFSTLYKNIAEYDQIWGWETNDPANDSASICSEAVLSEGNIQVAACSAYYVIKQECYNEDRTTFTDYILDFLQGKGFLERTSIFVGWYPAKLTESPDSYLIHLAYPLAIIFAYTVSIWYVARGFARWLQTQREILDFTHLYNNMIFRGWDCNIANQETATTEKKLLATEIEAAQWEEKFLMMKQNRSLREQRILLLTRALFHFVVLGLIGAGWTAIYYVVVRVKGASFWEEYAATMTIGALNFVLPLIFFGLSRFEQYQSKDELLLFIIRNIFVRLISIMILAISEISSTVRSEDDSNGCNLDAALCWETNLAQQIYSLIIFDTLLYFPLAVVVVVRNWLRKVPSESSYIQWIPKPIWTFLSNPEFDTAGQVLRVVHVQTLCWMGLVCAPMIPLITSISFTIMILLNGATVFFCNLRPLTVFRASRSSSTFTGAILIGLVLSMIPSALVFTWLRPSLGCSPFRGLDYVYQAVVVEMCRTPQWIQSVLFFLDNFVAVGLVVLVLVLILTYFVAKAQAAAAQLKHSEKRLKAMARDKRRLVQFTKILYTH